MAWNTVDWKWLDFKIRIETSKKAVEFQLKANKLCIFTGTLTVIYEWSSLWFVGLVYILVLVFFSEIFFKSHLRHDFWSNGWVNELLMRMTSF